MSLADKTDERCRKEEDYGKVQKIRKNIKPEKGITQKPGNYAYPEWQDHYY